MPRGIYPRRVKRHAVVQPQDQSYKIIPLTQQQNALVSTKDFKRLSQWNWCAGWNHRTKTFYAQRSVGSSRKPGRRTVYMHQEIMGGLCDHIDPSQTLDNRRSNLRRCTEAENVRNQKMRRTNASGFRGVWRHKQRGKLTNKWRSSVTVNRRKIHLGLFLSKEEAACAYDRAAKKFHGKFASLNFKTGQNYRK
jgi:hypothetical protein